MRNGKFDRNATCPFYQTVVNTKGGQVIGIACECIVDNLGFDVQTLLRFRNKQELEDYFQIFCSDMNESCPYWKAINQKYK